jgi:hypothetical protein
MRNDPVTKILLGLIAAGLWALTLTQFELPEANAGSMTPPDAVLERSRVAGQDEASHTFRRERAPAAATAAPSSRPLRWRVSYAAAWDTDTTGDNECFTVVSVLNTSSVTVSTDVEVFDATPWLAGTASLTLAPGDSQNVFVVAGGASNSIPFKIDESLPVTDFLGGFANVHADDPRILVSAFITCKEDGGTDNDKDLRSIANIPAYPVGSTAEFFQAGMPAAWTPGPMAVPEVPELPE